MGDKPRGPAGSDPFSDDVPELTPGPTGRFDAFDPALPQIGWVDLDLLNLVSEVSSPYGLYPDMVQNCLPALAKLRRRSFKYSTERKGKIDEVVIHDTDSKPNTTFAFMADYLSKPQADGRHVSIHYLIGRDNGELVAIVPEELAAILTRWRNWSTI